MLLMALGGLCFIGVFVCSIIILIAAFQDEVWKGVVSLLCWIYLLYYAIAEWQNSNKWTVVGAWIGLSVIGYIFYFMGMASMIRANPGAFNPATPGGLTPPMPR